VIEHWNAEPGDDGAAGTMWETHATTYWLFGACADLYHEGCRGSYLAPGIEVGTVMAVCSCGCHADDQAATRSAGGDGEG
jgi:hypothetical protein